MSYSSFGNPGCPTGWIEDPLTHACSSPTATQCPPGFKIGAPGECWPDSADACKLIGRVFDPAKPDRCMLTCPDGTSPDANGVCAPMKMGSTLFWAGAALVGVVGLAALFARRA